MHPILATVLALTAALKDAYDCDPMYLTPAEKAAALVDLSRLEGQLLELRLRVLAEAQDLADEEAARDAAAWLAPRIHGDYRSVRAELEFARSLGQRPLIATALANGSLTRAHAVTALHALEALPSTDADLLSRAEAALVAEASHVTPAQLRSIGRHLLAVVDPEAADEAEGRALLAEEQGAERMTRLTLRPLGDGVTRIAGLVPDHVASHLRTCLDAFTQPRVAALDADGRRLPMPRLRGLAFGDLIGSIDPATLPDHGGDTTTMTITVSLEALRQELGAATIGAGAIGGAAIGSGAADERLSASTARRLACTARLIPAVLGNDSEVLDLGRSSRLFSKAQRRALRARHPTCQAVDCTVPSVWTDAHHRDPWAAGGETDLANGTLLCRHHHARAHDPRFQVTYRVDRRVAFHRRT